MRINISANVSVKSKPQHPPPPPPQGNPRAFDFSKIIVQIPPCPGQNAINDRRTAETPSVVEQNLYTAISRKVVEKNVHATIPKGNMGYAQYTVSDTVAVEPTFVSFL